MKRCTTCDTDRPLADFDKCSRSRDGLQWKCKPCRREYLQANRARVRTRQREYMIRTGRQGGTGRPTFTAVPRGDIPSPSVLRKYGLTLAQYESMRVAQADRCAICFQFPESNRLSIDHDHETGAVRGLLCTRCNWALGIMLDDPERLQSAATYLRSNAGADACAFGGEL